MGPANGPDRCRRHALLQGLLLGTARDPGDDRRRPVERAVRDDSRRRAHVYLVPRRDRRPSEPAMEGGAHWLPLREHQDLATLTGRRGPRSEALRQQIRHRLPPASVRTLVAARATVLPRSDRWRGADQDDLLLRPDHRRAPPTAGAGGVVQLLLFVGAGAGRRTPAV